MLDVSISAFEDELEKIAVYKEMASLRKVPGVPRVMGRGLDDLIRNIRRKIAPRAPETAKSLEAEALKYKGLADDVTMGFDPRQGASFTVAHKGGKVVPDRATADTLGGSLGHELGHAADLRAGNLKFRGSKGRPTEADRRALLGDEARATLAATEKAGPSTELSRSYGTYLQGAQTTGARELERDAMTRALQEAGRTSPRVSASVDASRRLHSRIGRESPIADRIKDIHRQATDPNFNPRAMAALNKPSKDSLRAQRRQIEAGIARDLGPAAAKRARRSVNKQRSELFLNPTKMEARLQRPIPR